MPVWLRKFYYKKMEDAMTAQKKANEKNNKSKATAKPNIKKPMIGPRR